MASRHLVPSAILFAAVSACGSDTSTGTPGPRSADLTDPTVVSAEVAALDSAFAAPVTQSYLALAPLMSLAGGLAPGSTAPLSSTCATPLPPMPPVAPYSGILASAFPDSVLRHVFAYDSTSSSYRLTADSSGPAAGVRFLLYPVNATGQTLFPLSTIGHLDLIDVSGTGPLALHAQVTDSAGGGIDYSIAPTGTLAAYSAVLAGSMTNASHLATFSDTTGLVGSTFTEGASVDATAEDVHVSISATRAVADPFDNYYTLRFTLRHGQETVGLAGTISTYCTVSTTNLTVTVNALDFAQVTNDAHGLVFTRVDGQLIGTAQIQAVTDLLGLQGALFQAFITLFTPARPFLSS